MMGEPSILAPATDPGQTAAIAYPYKSVGAAGRTPTDARAHHAFQQQLELPQSSLTYAYPLPLANGNPMTPPPSPNPSPIRTIIN